MECDRPNDNKQAPVLSTSSDYGNVTLEKSRYNWVIANFPGNCFRAGECIRSPIFVTNINGECKWRLELYPYNYRQGFGSYVSLYLLTENKFPVKATFSLSFLNDEGLYCNKHTMPSQNFELNESWGFNNFISRLDLLQQLKNVTLTVSCKIWDVCIPNQNELGINLYPAIPSAAVHRLLVDYEQLFLNEDLSDVTLVTEESKELRAHKVILSARSEVFASMFYHDMKEKITNSVDITDIDYETLKELLRFIYCGRVENLDKLAKNLYVAADKYSIEDLMKFCVDYLCRTLGKDSAVDYLGFAYLHDIARLKTEARTYIAKNIKQFENKSDLKGLKNSETEILFELFQELMQRMNI